MLSAVLRYYETPYARKETNAPVIWKKGSARLLDYGQFCGQDIQNPKKLVLFIPSLINRYYILDLEKERSFLKFLATQDIYPLVMDWGVPSVFEENFDCTDYITQILSPAIDFIAKFSAQPINLAGYCMGGVLALAATKLKPSKVASLALLATPWDFHCPEFSPFVLEKKWQSEITKQIDTQKALPAEFIQSLFYLTDPFLFEQKFRRYFNMEEGSRGAKDFVALEHWVNDGVPMTAGVAKDCLVGWVQENQLATGKWKIGNIKITPPQAKLPTFIVIPKNDNVVPFACAMPLATATPHAHIVSPSAGHVGMIVGSKAARELWLPYAEWLKSNG